MPSEHQYRLRWVDVFTERALAGNPLAVVLDPQDLTAEQMQAIARETNLSETTFVLPPKDRRHAAHAARYGLRTLVDQRSDAQVRAPTRKPRTRQESRPPAVADAFTASRPTVIFMIVSATPAAPARH